MEGDVLVSITMACCSTPLPHIWLVAQTPYRKYWVGETNNCLLCGYISWWLTSFSSWCHIFFMLFHAKLKWFGSQSSLIFSVWFCRCIPVCRRSQCPFTWCFTRKNFKTSRRRILACPASILLNLLPRSLRKSLLTRKYVFFVCLLGSFVF